MVDDAKADTAEDAKVAATDDAKVAATEDTSLGRGVWALLAVMVVSLLLVFTAVGKPYQLPWKELALDTPERAIADQDGGVYVDMSRQRLVFFDKNQCVTAIVSLITGEVPITEACELERQGDTIYVFGVRREEDSEFVANEAVLAYDTSGRFKSVVWQSDSLAGKHVGSPSVIELVASDDSLCIVRIVQSDDGAKTLSLIEIPADGGEPKEVKSYTLPHAVYDAAYDAKAKRLYVTTSKGELLAETEDGSFKQLASSDGSLLVSVDVTHDGRLVVSDTERQKLLLVDPNNERPAQVLGDDLVAYSAGITDAYIAIATDTGEVVLYGIDDALFVHPTHPTTFDTCALSPAYQLFNALVLVGVIALNASLVGLVVVAAKRVLEKGEHERVSRAVLALAVSSVILGCMTYFSFTAFMDVLQARHHEISTLANFLYLSSYQHLGEVANREAARLEGTQAKDDGKDLKQLNNTLDYLAYAASQDSSNLSYNLYAVDSSGDVRYLTSNRRDLIYGARVASNAEADEISSCAQSKDWNVGELESVIKVRYGSTLDGFSVYALIPLLDKDGNCKAVLELGSRIESFAHAQAEKMLENILTFVVANVAIYMAASELSNGGKVMLRYRQLRRKGDEGAGALLVRPMVFITSIASGLDMSLAVIVSKDLLAAIGASDQSLLVGLPLTVSALAKPVGARMYVVLGKKKGCRTVVMCALAAGVVTQLACLLATLNGWYWLFVVGKLASSMCLAVVGGSWKDIARTATAKEDCDEALRGLGAASAATTFAGFAGGVVSGVFGTAWIYCAAALAVALTAVLMCMAIPVGASVVVGTDGDVDADGAKSVEGELGFLKLLREPGTWGIFVASCLPTVLAEGYEQYVFPLFMESTGMVDATISQLSVVGRAVRQACAPVLQDVKSHVTSRRMLTIVSLLGLSVTFALFVVNQSVAWALLAIVVISLLSNFAESWKTVFKNRYKARGYTKAELSELIEDETGVVTRFRPMILSALMTKGTTAACLLLSVWLAAGAALFALCTPKPKGDQ